MTILGSLDGVEAGLRQLRRTRPLETTEFEIDADIRVVVPTIEEMLRVKAYLVIQRNYVRDYLDVVGLADVVGTEPAVSVLGSIDDYYTDRSAESGSVLTALVTHLADPTPRDTDVINELSHYKGLDPQWHEWSSVVSRCQDLSLALAGAE